MARQLNIATTLVDTAARFPEQRGIVTPAGRDRSGYGLWSEITFRQLDELSSALARGFDELGMTRGTRIVLMVRPGIEFIALTYALFKTGAIVVLIDPGMGPRRVFRCLDQVEPQGFVAISAVQALRVLNVGRFPEARWNVTVGRRWFWGGPTYYELSRRHYSKTNDAAPLHPDGIVAAAPVEATPSIAPTLSTDPAAIIFTSGSTGPAKGVVYEHGMFAAQVEALRDHYRIEPGGIDLPGYPLFALFNAAMGVTTVIPDMDPARPAQVDPAKIVEAISTQQVIQGFGSPAIWNRVGRYCEEHRLTLPTLSRVFSAGAPVPVNVLASMKKALTTNGAEMYTPYGATEALPVCSIAATEVLARTARQTGAGAGTCVGRPFATIRLRIIAITDGPIRSLADVRELPPGEIGEIIVRGPMVTREYFRQPDATAAAKIPDHEEFWHRMGDVGYLDSDGALWFCGRKAHIVSAETGLLFTECVEPIFNTHPQVARCALVGVGNKPRQTPVIVVEQESSTPWKQLHVELRSLAAAHPNTSTIDRFLVYPGSLPVDVRHNIKINREQLAEWAARRM
jgi:acyl-CoA synthetase (AMP-forming)/AMP-acid ligase II